MKADEIAPIIHNLNLDYEKNNILLLMSNYTSTNKKLIDANHVEVVVKEEVDGKIISKKYNQTILNDINMFKEHTMPFSVLRTLLITRDDDNEKWLTMLDIELD